MEIDELAYQIALEAHRGQYRRDGATDYIEHPCAVAELFESDNKQARAVAYLHDVIEDTRVTPEDLIARGIPPSVVEAVLLLTKKKPYTITPNTSKP